MDVAWSAREAAASAPLAGVRVLDFTELLPGPFLTQSLAELGAEVIKIERPPHGDNARRLSPRLFAAVNRGKRSLCVNLKDAADRAQVLALADAADVLVESYRPGVIDRLGFGFDAMAERNPRLLHVSLNSYGAKGARAAWPGHDVNYLAASGALALSGAEAGSAGMPLPVADLAGAVYALAAINAALVQRARTGQGQRLDVSLTDCMLHWMNPRLAYFRQAGADTLVAQRAMLERPAYGPFTCRDGRQLALGALEDHFWVALTGVLDLSPYDGEAWRAYRARSAATGAINQRIAQALLALDRDEAVRRLAAADVPVSEVLAPNELAMHPPFVARGLYTDTAAGPLCRFPVRLAGMAEPAATAPALGEATTKAPE
ncbi:MAG: CoA transferase [Burkholderiales bacterium]|nr:CoA transferase [Burkholderiales bacterium]